MKHQSSSQKVAKARNWTAESADGFAHKIAFGFIAQIEKALQEKGISRSAFAQELGVSAGAVSQVLNNPQNLTLKTMSRYCRALSLKAAVVAYDDEDSENEKGLISPEVFVACWHRLECPRDLWDVRAIEQGRASTKQTFTFRIMFMQGQVYSVASTLIAITGAVPKGYWGDHSYRYLNPQLTSMGGGPDMAMLPSRTGEVTNG